MPNDPYQIGDTDSGITLVLSDRGVGVAAAHAIEHVTGGNDKIRDATTTLDGLMTAAQALKLSNIEENAQVTSAARIATALGGVGTESTLASDDLFSFLDTSAASALKRITTTNLITFLGGSLVNIGGTQSITGTKTFTDAVFTSATINGGSVNATINLGTNPFTGLLPVNKGGTGVSTSTGTGSVVLSSGPVLVAPTLGTPATNSFLTNCTNLPIVAGTTGTLTVARGGTGVTTLASGVVKSNGTILSSSAVDLTSAEVTGALPVTKGGTGVATLTAGVVKASGTSAFTTGTISLTTEVTGVLPVANGGTGYNTNSYGQLSSQTAAATAVDYTVDYVVVNLDTTLGSGLVDFDDGSPPSDNTLRYTGTTPRKFLIFASLDMASSATGAYYSIKLAKISGATTTLIAESRCDATSSGKTATFIAKLICSWVVELSTNDVVRLYVGAPNAGAGVESGTPQRMRLIATPV